MHRILFFKGQPFEVYSYGFMLVMAMAMGVAFIVRRARAFAITKDQALDFALAVLLGGMVGSRLIFVFSEWRYFERDPLQVFNIRGGGLWWHGGILGGLIGFLFYQWRSRIERGRLLDLIVPPVIVGHIVGRIGCFLNGCCVGRPTTLPWAVTFPDAPEWQCVLRHPTQLYEALGEMCILLFLTTVWERRGWRGSLFYLYLCLYAVLRFGVDYFREEPLLYGGLDLAQYLSFLLLIAGLVGLLRASSAGRLEVMVASHEEGNPVGN